MKINTISSEQLNINVANEISNKQKGNSRFVLLYFESAKELGDLLDWVAHDFHYGSWTTKNCVTLEHPVSKDGSNFTFDDIQHFSYDNIDILSVELFSSNKQGGDPIEESFAFLYSVQKYLDYIKKELSDKNKRELSKHEKLDIDTI